FKFIKLDKAQELESGFLLLQTKLGPILAGNGYMNKIHNANAISVETVVTCAAIQTSHNDMDQFWKLELIGIQDRPNEDDDEQALKQFKRSITKQNGRYQVRWPWKESKYKLKSHYGLCLERLKTLIKRLQNTEERCQKFERRFIPWTYNASGFNRNITTVSDDEKWNYS
ncbi:unnamed protein product, partial [Onchocerca ochengi]